MPNEKIKTTDKIIKTLIQKVKSTIQVLKNRKDDLI
jgi:hypothetical protein